MENRNSCCRIIDFIVLLLSLVLQVICLAAPWWSIRHDGHNEQYAGVFYSIQCSEDEIEGETICKTKSYCQQHYEKISTSSDKFDNLREDYSYDSIVRLQVLLLVCFALTFVGVVLHICKLRRNSPSPLTVTASKIGCLAFAGAAMISHLSGSFIDINFNLQLDALNDTHATGFPYCVLLYTIAFLAVLVSVLVNTIEISKIQHDADATGQTVGAGGMLMPVFTTSAQGNSGVPYEHLQGHQEKK